MRFVISGGGTGGHVYPALAIARGLQEKYPESKILYIGSSHGIETELVPKAGFLFRQVKVAGFKRRLSLGNLTALFYVSMGLVETVKMLREFKPLTVIGTGGYVCGPVLMAAVLLNIPTLIHEQNALPGLTTRILARFVNIVTLTFEDSLKYLPRKARCKLTGLPVRSEFLTCTKDESRRKLGLPLDKFLVLSFGGSQGARSINQAMKKVISKFCNNPEIYFLHVTGPKQYGEFMHGFDIPKNGNTNIKSYLHEMPEVLCSADLVICRAGAATLAEITLLGVPAILIPYPHATANHQELNALALEKQGAAIMIRDEQLNGEILAQKIEKLVKEPELLQKMVRASKNLGRPQALEDILKCVEEII